MATLDELIKIEGVVAAGEFTADQTRLRKIHLAYCYPCRIAPAMNDYTSLHDVFQREARKFGMGNFIALTCK